MASAIWENFWRTSNEEWGDTTLPIPNIVDGPTVSKISRISGKDVVSFTFQVDEAYQAYEIRSVPSGTSPHSAGNLIESGSGGSANTDKAVDVTDDELVAVDSSEGDKTIKVFVQDLAGNWSE